MHAAKVTGRPAPPVRQRPGVGKWRLALRPRRLLVAAYMGQTAGFLSRSHDYKLILLSRLCGRHAWTPEDLVDRLTQRARLSALHYFCDMVRVALYNTRTCSDVGVGRQRFEHAG